MKEVKITGSGGLDEYDLEELSNANSPYDSYGVGTKMGTSADAPWFDTAYKLVEYDHRSVLKLSPGKISWPGKKQIFRQLDSDGNLICDIIGLGNENLSGAEALLKKVMDQGRALALPSLEASRSTFLKNSVAYRKSSKRFVIRRAIRWNSLRLAKTTREVEHAVSS